MIGHVSLTWINSELYNTHQMGPGGGASQKKTFMVNYSIALTCMIKYHTETWCVYIILQLL